MNMISAWKNGCTNLHGSGGGGGGEDGASSTPELKSEDQSGQFLLTPSALCQSATLLAIVLIDPRDEHSACEDQLLLVHLSCDGRSTTRHPAGPLGLAS